MIQRDIKFQIDEYIENGVPLGSFLYAVLTNDLITAISKADDVNKLHIPDIVTYLLNYLPSVAYGSEKNVKDWMLDHKNEEDWLAEDIERDRIRRAVYYEGRRTPH